MRVKDESEKASLKLSIKKRRSWHLVPSLHGKWKGKMWKQWEISSSWLQNHCGWWLQPWSLMMIASWQESDDKPKLCVEKQRHHSASKGLYSQGCDLSGGHVWFWELDYKEGRTPENWCLRTVVLEKTPESPLDSKEIRQSILREINPEYSLKGLMLKLQYFGHLIWTDDSLEKSLMLGKIEGKRRRGCQRMRWLDSITDAMNMNLS